MPDLVTVVVPVYDVEAYLPRCVDSLLTQSHEALDIVLVNDGSPDRSGEMCDDYAHLDPRVRVIHQENRGAGSARNVGVAAARGSWVTFVDPDDWVHRDLVGDLLSLAHGHQASLAVYQFLRTRTSGIPVRDVAESVKIFDGVTVLRLYAGPFASLMTSPCAKLFRTELLTAHPFPTGKYYEDDFTTYRIVASAGRVALSDAVRYYYFLRPGSATQRHQDPERLLDRVTALLEQAEFFGEVGCPGARSTSLHKAFLIQRKVRRSVGRLDPSAADRFHDEIRHVADELRQSSATLSIRLFATLYALAPRLLDIVIDVGHAVKRLWGMRSQGGATARDRSGREPLRAAATNEAGKAVDHGEPVGGPRELEIIVVAYGAPALLRKALEPIAELPVLVVDNSSLVEISDLCAELGCRYLDPGRNGGFGAGVNVGLANRRSQGSDVLLLNPDAVISPQQIQELHEVLLASHNLASVGPCQVDESGKLIRVSWPFSSPLGVWLEAWGLWRLRPLSEYVSGAILMLRAEAIQEVGPFDEDFFLYAEEADWQYRATKLGWRHEVIDRVTAMHVGGGTSSNEAKRMTHFHGSQERFLRKHHGALGWNLARVGQVLGDLARSTLRRGDEAKALRARAMLYAKGPLGAETRFKDSSPSEKADLL